MIDRKGLVPLVVLNKRKEERFKFNKTRSEKKVPMRLDITTLNSLAGLVFKKSNQVNRKSLTNLKKLMEMIDDKIYRTRDDLSYRFDLINLLLEARLTENLENDGMLIEYCATGGIPEQILSELPMYSRLSYNDVIGINRAVSERLNFAYIYSYKEEFEDMLVRLESGDYKSIRGINKEFADLCKDYISETRKAALIDQTNTLSLSDTDYEEKMEVIFEDLIKPSRVLQTGIKALNSMLGDGYQASRLYTFVGLPKQMGTLSVMVDDKLF